MLAWNKCQPLHWLCPTYKSALTTCQMLFRIPCRIPVGRPTQEGSKAQRARHNDPPAPPPHGIVGHAAWNRVTDLPRCWHGIIANRSTGFAQPTKAPLQRCLMLFRIPCRIPVGRPTQEGSKAQRARRNETPDKHPSRHCWARRLESGDKFTSVPALNNRQPQRWLCPTYKAFHYNSSTSSSLPSAGTAQQINASPSAIAAVGIDRYVTVPCVTLVEHVPQLPLRHP